MAKSLDSPVKILLADDSVTMHRAVSISLKKEAFELICVDNGKDALRLCYEYQPAVLLADVDMPEMGGLELCRKVKNDNSLSKTKVVLLCGSFDQIEEQQLESVPSDGRLWKPFESHVLVTLLKTLLKDGNSSLDSVEPTAPNLKKPVLKKPATPPPSTQKEKLIEASRNSALAHSSNEEVKVSLEETRPIKIEDLFGKNAAAPVEDSDIMRELTQETFLPQNDFTKLHEVRVTDEPTMAPIDAFAFEKQLKDDAQLADNTPELLVPELNPAETDKNLMRNLWEPEASSESIPEIELSIPKQEDSYTTLSPDSPLLDDLDQFEVLNAAQDSADSTEFQPDTTLPEHPWMDDRDIQNIAKQTSAQLASQGSSQNHLQGVHSSEEHLRALIRNELEGYFKIWLQKELQKQLDDVIAELNKV